MKTNWLIIFAVTAAAVLAAIIFEAPLIYFVAKPLLMITLLLYFIAAAKGYRSWRIFVIIALVFSWAGDVFLMWDDLFIAGLAAFLFAHVFYIIAYQKTGAAQGKISFWALAGFTLAGATLIRVLYPGLGSLLIPVVVYALVLLSMAVWAHKRKGATSKVSFLLVAVGAIFFVISDSLIAINRFAFDVPSERLLVMMTYIAAQFMIVHGLLKHENP